MKNYIQYGVYHRLSGVFCRAEGSVHHSQPKRLSIYEKAARGEPLMLPQAACLSFIMLWLIHLMLAGIHDLVRFVEDLGDRMIDFGVIFGYTESK